MAYDYNTDWFASSTDAFKTLMDTHADALLSGQDFTNSAIAYSFYTESARPPYSDYSYVPTGESAQFEAFNQREKDLTQAVFNQVEAFTGLSFEEVAPGEGDVRFGTHNMTVGGYANYPSNYYEYGNNFVSTDLTGRDFSENLIHEIGHSLGLKHPQPYNGGYESAVLPDALDTPLMSIMTYNSIDISPSYFSPVNPLSFGPLDIHTLQELYGRGGDDSGITYRFDESSATGDSVVSDFSTVSFDLDLSGAEGSDFMWLFGTTGRDKLYLGEVGGRVDADLESGRISIGETGTLGSVYDYASATKDSASFGEVGNIRLAPDTEETAHGVEQVVFTDLIDVVKIGDLVSTVELRGGNDRISGFTDGVFVDGGSGEDEWCEPGAATDSGVLNDFTVEVSRDGLLVQKSGTAESITLKNFEKVELADQVLAFEANPEPATREAFRLYQAAFDREPDKTGLGYWVAQSDTMELSEIAARFIDSAEFGQLYGTEPSNGEFLRAVYRNVLDREPDGEGYEWWFNEMAGDNGRSREDVLVGFSESSENIEATEDVIALGMLYEAEVV